MRKIIILFLISYLFPTVTDIDGNVYETILIGDQLWMAENLKVIHYNDGDEILTGYSGSEWSWLDSGAYAVSPDDNNPSNAEIYGNLYNWYVVDDDRGVCPENWHVPSDAEFTVLTDFLGGESVAGGKMKETGLEHWNSPNTGATNESGLMDSLLGTGHTIVIITSLWVTEDTFSLLLSPIIMPRD